MPPLLLNELLRETAAGLERADAEALLLHALGRDRAWLFAHGRDPAPAEVVEVFKALVERRAAGEPVAYLTGRRGFWTLDLEVTPATLIPRPETERLVELALERLDAKPGRAIADLGTGSGAIALALASERPQAQVVAVDASEAALKVAQANADRYGLSRVQFRRGSWLAPLAGECYDLIASNPPYIAATDQHLDQGDLRYEPRSALSAGQDGLDDIRTIIRDAPEHLRGGGWLLLEHGCDQGPAVAHGLRERGFEAVQTWQDLEGRDRVSGGRWR
ncbi:MAG TPA: peptide chain release factor N(5)-glutamine methyltransferase [Stenotrophomonas sp.]|jgi:release factor glutamine methyltransferase